MIVVAWVCFGCAAVPALLYLWNSFLFREPPKLQDPTPRPPPPEGEGEKSGGSFSPSPSGGGGRGVGSAAAISVLIPARNEADRRFPRALIEPHEAGDVVAKLPDRVDRKITSAAE